jgi:hypothetical protein
MPIRPDVLTQQRLREVFDEIGLANPRRAVKQNGMRQALAQLLQLLPCGMLPRVN